MGLLTFVAGAGAVGSLPQLSVGDAKQFGHFGSPKAGAKEVLYRSGWARCVSA